MDITIEYDAFHPQLQDCPAGCNIDTGVIVINPTLFDVLTDFQKKFVILHEEGHIKLHTHDEIAADAYAFDMLAGTEFRSLKQSVAFLDQLLDPNYPSTEQRKTALYKRALDWDKAHGKLTDGVKTFNLFGLEIFRSGDEEEQERLAENSDAINQALLNQTSSNFGTYVPYIFGFALISLVGYYIYKTKLWT